MAVDRNVLGDTHVSGALSCNTFTPPSGCINAAAIEASTGVQATKLEHQYIAVGGQAGNMAAETVPLHVVHGTTADIVQFSIGCRTVPLTASTATVALKKNGTSIMQSTLQCLSTDTNLVIKHGTLNTSSAVQDDVFEVAVSTSGTGYATGVFWSLVIREDAD
jgi:hypothetical protein